MNLKLPEFYKKKSIQKSYNFRVFFNDTNTKTAILDPIPLTEQYHVTKITLPHWDFKKEVMYYGPYPRSFPVLTSDGFELTITFEEDDSGTISKLINWLQRRIISNKQGRIGLYESPGPMKSLSIIIQILDDTGREVSKYEYKGCYFLKASDISLDYSSNESVKIDITFGTDNLNFNMDIGAESE